MQSVSRIAAGWSAVVLPEVHYCTTGEEYQYNLNVVYTVLMVFLMVQSTARTQMELISNKRTTRNPVHCVCCEGWGTGLA